MIQYLKKYSNLNIVDNSKGIVTINTQCFIDFKRDKIIYDLKKKFLDKYKKSIKINNIAIKPLNSFPKNFNDFRYKGIKISKESLKKSSGNFLVIYQNSRGKRLHLFFRYKVDAKILLFKAKNNIINGKILSSTDIKKEWVVFKNIFSKFIEEFKDREYVAKNYIKKGSILASYMIKKASLIRKNEIVRAIINESGIEIDFFGKALSDANLNDIVKIVGNNGKVYRAKVIGRGLVRVE